MSYTPVSNTYRVVSCSHGAFSYPDTIGGSVDEEIGQTDTYPGTRLSATSAIDSYKYRAVVECSHSFTPVVRGTKATLTFTLLEYDGSSTGTLVATNAIASEYHGDLNSKPHRHTQHFFSSAGNTEDLAPISVT